MGQRLPDIFRQPAINPFAKRDYQETDQRVFPLETLPVSEQFLLTWHADHAVKEVHIVGLEIV
jgi:hypothetical protein